jgi:AmmeMemoRadiSam system protein A
MTNTLSKDQQNFLLDVAHRAITHYLDKGETPAIETEDVVLREKRGAFVTLKVDDQLRGCIGYPIPHKPLIETIIDCAIAAASQDYRFPSIGSAELDRLSVEISILTLPRAVEDVSEIKIGDHGIIISKGLSKGLLLPQVPVEWDWDLETYLNHGCLKAGLPEDAWKKGAKIEIFSAQIFSD